jgi:alpha-tubulin suppressor-like RCC1 family protein
MDTESRCGRETAGRRRRGRKGSGRLSAVALATAIVMLFSSQPASAVTLTAQRYQGWGLNTFGQLGDNTTTDAESPTAPSASATWKQISGGGYHTIALHDDGTER